jgi:hypothetical protein
MWSGVLPVIPDAENFYLNMQLAFIARFYYFNVRMQGHTALLQ